MGCASSVSRVDEQSSTASKKQEVATSREQAEVKRNSPSLQEAVFASEITKLINEATSGTKPKDPWIVLHKCVDLISSVFGIKTCSIAIYTSSGLSCKLACSAGSALNDLVLQHPDLLPAETLGFVTSATTSQKTVCVKAGDELWSSLAREPYPDFALLSGPRGACSDLAVLPLCGGAQCPGALLLGHMGPLAGALRQSWLSTLVPLLSLYVAESPLVRTLSLIEKVVDAGSLSGLAHAVTGELGGVFEWCHREDVEARLVVLNQEGDAATVYCKVPTAAALVDDRTSLRSGLSSSIVRSGPNALLEEGLVGTHMSLDNTLTKRCLTGRQRLLFVADVMQALKLYGEPWKDIFFDAAAVLTPSWVLAAPLMHEGRRLGAVLWLSTCRVNSDALMRTASTCASPIIHAVTRAVAMHQMYTAAAAAAAAASGSGGGGGGVVGLLGDSAYSKGGAWAAAGAGTSHHGVSSFSQLSSRQSSSLSRGRTQRLGAAGHDDGLPGRGSTDPDVLLGEGDPEGTGSRAGTSVQDMPVRYVLRHSPSTSALMRMYKSTIAQRAPAAEDDRTAGSVHEIRILSKAGEGAFGSVYVGRWRNIVVAVKVIKDTSSGARSLKTAWELAVNKSLAHPSVVTVHAILTDVHLQKTSTRVLRFVPADAMEAQAAAAAAAAISSAGGGGSSGGAASISHPGTAAAAAACSPCARLSTPGITAAAAAAAGGLGGGGGLTPRSNTNGGASTAGGGGGGIDATPNCPLPGKDAALGPISGGLTMGGGPNSPLRPGLGLGMGMGGSLSGTGPATPPNFGRMSAGSNAGPPSAALLRPAKQLAPKVHAILMEYCNLGGLHKYIDRRVFFRDRSVAPPAQDTAVSETSRAPAPLTPELLHLDHILATLSEVAAALQYLHAQGFVHCDLKPENVLLKEANNRRGFTAKLADFGLSELRSSDGTVVGDLGGTVTHVAPESVLHRQVSAASDMYAFGVLMWELYTGQQPYRSLLSQLGKREDRHRALLVRVVHEGLRPSFPPGVPQDYWSLAVQCWNPEPAARPTTAEVLQALEAMYAKYAAAAPSAAATLQPQQRHQEGAGTGTGAGAGAGQLAAGTDPLAIPA